MAWPRLRRLAIAVGFASAGCHDYHDVLFHVQHWGAPYDPQTIDAHTLGFVCAYAEAVGAYPNIGRVNAYWKDEQKTFVIRDDGSSIEPVGGYSTDNGIHLAITDNIEDSALWHELAHVALCRAGDCDDTHKREDLWLAMQQGD